MFSETQNITNARAACQTDFPSGIVYWCMSVPLAEFKYQLRLYEYFTLVFYHNFILIRSHGRLCYGRAKKYTYYVWDIFALRVRFRCFVLIVDTRPPDE